MSRRAIVCCFALFALSLIGAYTALGQVTSGAVKGSVIDQSGATVPNALVELTNTGTAMRWDAKTAVDGLYQFPEVPPGLYKIKVTCQGFAEWNASLTLRVTQIAVIQATLSPASLAMKIEVEDVTPVINPESSALSDVKEATRLSTMPLANRNFLSVLNFTPGVYANAYSSAPGGNSYTRINGIMGGSVEYLVDGMSAAEKFTNELQTTPPPIDSIQELKLSTTNASAEYARPGTVEVLSKSGTNEFHGSLFELLQNSAVKARDWHSKNVNFLNRNEFGGNLGGPVILPKIFNGKNKTFFFVDAEHIVEHQLVSSMSYTVPTADFKQGNFAKYLDNQGSLIPIYDPASSFKDPATGAIVRTPFVGNSIPGSRMSPVSKKVLSYLPEPNLTGNWSEEVNYQDPNAKQVDEKSMYTAKIDQLFGSNRLSGRYTRVLRNMVYPYTLLNDRTMAESGHNVALSFVQTLRPTLVNEVRAGLQRFNAYSGPVLIDPPITQTLGLPTYPGTVAWPGICFNDQPDWTQNGWDCIDRANPKTRPTLTTNWVDNLVWVKGRHEFKFGAYVATNAANTLEAGQPGGSYSFDGLFTALQDPAAVKQGIYSQPVFKSGIGLADMALGLVSYDSYNVYPTFYTRQNEYSGYAQDTWKVSKRLTLTLGLRYEYWTPFRDKRDQAVTMKFDAAGGPVLVYPGSGSIAAPNNVVQAFTSQGLKFMSAQQAGFPNSLWAMPRANFAPRLGGAWQLNNKTVVRGGYGMYRYVMPLVQYHQNTRKNPPFYTSVTSIVDENDNEAAMLAFPAGGSGYANQAAGARDFGKDLLNGGAVGASKGNGWGILPWDPNYKIPVAHEWNFTVERALPAKFGSRLSYIGTHGGNLAVYDPINAPAPRKLLPPGTSSAQRRAYPDFSVSGTSSMDLLRWEGYSNSNQFQAEIFRNFSSGTVFQAYYTYAKTLTNAEGSANSYGGIEIPPAALTGNASLQDRLRMAYANDSYLPRQTFSVNGSYPLPLGKGKKFLGTANPIVDKILGGWQTSAFAYYRSGTYFAPYYASQSSGTVLMPGKSAELPAEQRTFQQYFDARIWAADKGVPYNGEPFATRADSLDNDFRNNSPRNYMLGPSFYNVDASLMKYTPITEKVRLRLDAQFFNLFNHKNLANPNKSGVITTWAGRSRLVQFQARIEF